MSEKKGDDGCLYVLIAVLAFGMIWGSLGQIAKRLESIDQKLDLITRQLGPAEAELPAAK